MLIYERQPHRKSAEETWTERRCYFLFVIGNEETDGKKRGICCGLIKTYFWRGREISFSLSPVPPVSVAVTHSGVGDLGMQCHGGSLSRAVQTHLSDERSCCAVCTYVYAYVQCEIQI